MDVSCSIPGDYFESSSCALNESEIKYREEEILIEVSDTEDGMAEKEYESAHEDEDLISSQM